MVHTRCCVIKVHGDYLDTRIKNTPTELADYDVRMNGLLDQVFDQFGLIICGWSADWDVALRASIERAPSRRFTTYWASKGAPSETALRLIQHRDAQVIHISDADNYFTSLQEKVEALEQFSHPHPLSVQTAVASTKKYLAEDRFRIRLHDLIDEEVTRVIGKLCSPEIAKVNVNITNAELTQRVHKYDIACKTLISMAVTCGQWGGREAVEIWQRTQQRLYSTAGSGGNVMLVEYQRYPIALITYAACLGAILAKNFEFISSLVRTTLRKKDVIDKMAIEIVPPYRMLQLPEQSGKKLQGMENNPAPLNSWLQNSLFRCLGDNFSSSHEFTLAFDQVEILLALAYGKYGIRNFQRPEKWFPPGCYCYRNDDSLESIIIEITNSLTSPETAIPYVTSGLFGDSASECQEQLNSLRAFVNKINWN